MPINLSTNQLTSWFQKGGSTSADAMAGNRRAGIGDKSRDRVGCGLLEVDILVCKVLIVDLVNNGNRRRVFVKGHGSWCTVLFIGEICYFRI